MNLISKGFDIIHFAGEGSRILTSNGLEIIFFISQFSRINEDVTADAQLSSADIINALKGQRPLFMVFSNFCYGAYTQTSDSGVSDSEIITLKNLEKYFPSANLTITDNYICPCSISRQAQLLRSAKSSMNIF